MNLKRKMKLDVMLNIKMEVDDEFEDNTEDEVKGATDCQCAGSHEWLGLESCSRRPTGQMVRVIVSFFG